MRFVLHCWQPTSEKRDYNPTWAATTSVRNGCAYSHTVPEQIALSPSTQPQQRIASKEAHTTGCCTAAVSTDTDPGRYKYNSMPQMVHASVGPGCATDGGTTQHLEADWRAALR